jgi:hypothetical protein
MVTQKNLRGRWLVVAALAVGILSTLGVVLALAAPHRFIPSGGPNLSEANTLDTVSADVAVSLDEDHAAVVWIEESSDPGLGDGPFGSVWLQRASVGGGESWSGREAVFVATTQACATEAAVAVTGTTAHVAYISWRPCLEDTTETVLYHTTCNLSAGGCAAAQVITSATFAPGAPRLNEVDIALDGVGNPHFAYVVYDTTGATGTVYYRDAASPSDEVVPDSTPGRNPAIAWSDGDVHVAWEGVDLGGEIEDILYNRKEGGGSWVHPVTPPSFWHGKTNRLPRNPAVVAQGERVIVAWDWQWTDEPDQNEYVLAYTRILTAGPDEGKWMPMYEVGTQGGSVGPLYIGDVGFRDPPYYTYTSTAGQAAFVHLRYLQPSVALDRVGMPAIVWHADNEAAYDIMYSQAQSMTESTAGDIIFSWSEPAVFDRQATGDSAGAAVAQPTGVVSPSLHVAYLHQDVSDWETFYEGRTPGVDLNGENAVYLPLVIRYYMSEVRR